MQETETSYMIQAICSSLDSLCHCLSSRFCPVVYFDVIPLWRGGTTRSTTCRHWDKMLGNIVLDSNIRCDADPHLPTPHLPHDFWPTVLAWLTCGGWVNVGLLALVAVGSAPTSALVSPLVNSFMQYLPVAGRYD